MRTEAAILGHTAAKLTCSAGKKQTAGNPLAAAAAKDARRLTYRLPGARGFTPAVLLPAAAADWYVRGKACWSSGFHPQAARPGRKVHQYERCESDRVADRPFALHAEALDRRERDTRL